jgi:hypothetical protein
MSRFSDFLSLWSQTCFASVLKGSNTVFPGFQECCEDHIYGSVWQAVKILYLCFKLSFSKWLFKKIIICLIQHAFAIFCIKTNKIREILVWSFHVINEPTEAQRGGTCLFQFAQRIWGKAGPGSPDSSFPCFQIDDTMSLVQHVSADSSCCWLSQRDRKYRFLLGVFHGSTLYFLP